MKQLLFLFLSLLMVSAAFAQTKGEVTVVKDPLIDSLIAKRIELNRKKPTATSPVSTTIYSGMGYRVQIYYGSERKEVFNEQLKFKGLFPKQNTYITYKEPNYYLRVGDFRTRSDAQKFLNELKVNYPTLFIFREKINAPNLDSTYK